MSEENAEATESPAEFEDLTSDNQNESTNPDMQVILDIPVVLSLEVGRTSQSIRELLKLNEGSVVELDRYAGEPLDVLVNGKLIAHAEVVVINEKFGLRLTDVLSPKDRLERISKGD